MSKRILPLILTLLFLLAGCQLAPPAVLPPEAHTAPELEESLTPEQAVPDEAPVVEDTPTIQPSPTAIPEYAVISSDQLDRLQVSVSAMTASPVSLTWSMDAKTIAVQSVDGFSIFSAETGALLKSIVLSEPYYLMDGSIERELIAVTTDQLSVEFRSMDTGEIVTTIVPDELFLSGVFSPDGYSFLLSSGYDIAAQEWDIDSSQLVKTIEGFETAAPTYSARYDRTGTSLIWTARATVQVYDLLSGQFGAVMGHEDFVNCSDLAPNGRLLAAATLSTIESDFKPIVRLWDAYGGQILGNIQTGDSIATSVQFSVDGSMLVFGGREDVSIWLVQDQSEIWRQPSAGGVVRDVKFSPDGKALAIVDESGSLQILRIIQQ